MLIDNATKIYKGSTLINKVYKGDAVIYNGQHPLNIENNIVYYRPNNTGNADLVIDNNKIYARKVF